MWCSRLYLIGIMFLGTSVLYAQKTDRDYLRSGNKLYNDSLFVKAEVDYRKALEINPKSADAMFNLGNSLLMQQKAKEAMEQFEAAARLEKDKEKLAHIYHNMGVILQSSKQLPQCIEAKDDETRYNLVLAQKQLKDQQQQQQNQDQQKDQKQDQKQDEKEKNKDQQDQQQQQQNQNQQQQQQNKDEMSKENAEQLLKAAMQEAAMQDEKDVQDKVKKQMQVSGKKLEKDW